MIIAGKARRRRENFGDLHLKYIDLNKETTELSSKSQNFLGAFGANTAIHTSYTICHLRETYSIYYMYFAARPSAEEKYYMSDIYYILYVWH